MPMKNVEAEWLAATDHFGDLPQRLPRRGPACIIAALPASARSRVCIDRRQTC